MKAVVEFIKVTLSGGLFVLLPVSLLFLVWSKCSYELTRKDF